MAPLDLLLFLSAGFAAGMVAGMAGVGGGIVFAPVLYFLFEATGVSPAIIAPLTIGTSLLCTLVASMASAAWHHRKGAVRWQLAVAVGISSSIAVLLTTLLVTTKPWYDGDIFQVLFGLLLVAVAARMLLEPAVTHSDDAPDIIPTRLALIGLGSAAGAVAAAVGVGGGIVLVPALTRLFGVPIRQAVATSSGAIIFIASLGVFTYVVAGHGQTLTPSTAVGFVDIPRGLLLSLPAIASTRLGASLAHRINPRTLRWTFAAVAVIVAARLVTRAL
jgi:uncharacterized membrane protein YfcA